MSVRVTVRGFLKFKEIEGWLYKEDESKNNYFGVKNKQSMVESTSENLV